jgi:hypothetical protein
MVENGTMTITEDVERKRETNANPPMNKPKQTLSDVHDAKTQHATTIRCEE